MRPQEIEFWQADRGRQHCRLRYTAAKNRWDRSLLWP
ncbi:pyridoxine 5'-phosphate oxidase C-terminal domain-containing protein [uncultured Friedmanniella sp.]